MRGNPKIQRVRAIDESKGGYELPRLDLLLNGIHRCKGDPKLCRSSFDHKEEVFILFVDVQTDISTVH